jgi:glycosyltransferase involved in cell wall biosynthesis
VSGIGSASGSSESLSARSKFNSGDQGVVERERIIVLADMRFASDTGIGKVQEALAARSPTYSEIVDLRVRGRYGSPFSPFYIALSIRKKVAGREPKGVVFWSAGFMPPLFSKIPTVVFVHDLIHLKHYGHLKRLYYNLILKRLYRRCSAIVCVSDFTRQEFIEWSGVPPGKVYLIYNGLDGRYLGKYEAAELGFQYILYVGSHRSSKNLPRLIESYSRSALPSRSIHLVLTGSENQELRNLILRYGLEGIVHFLGSVPEDQLPALYKGAQAVVYVSLQEGFGLPLLEAMASEVPVITSNITAMPEIAADAALVVDPYSVKDIALGLDRITSDETLRASLIRAGRIRVNQFDWDASAGKFWKLMVQVARHG